MPLHVIYTGLMVMCSELLTRAQTVCTYLNVLQKRHTQMLTHVTVCHRTAHTHLYYNSPSTNAKMHEEKFRILTAVKLYKSIDQNYHTIIIYMSSFQIFGNCFAKNFKYTYNLINILSKLSHLNLGCQKSPFILYLFILTFTAIIIII